MTGKSVTGMRLCPSCANTIEEDAANCRYCKADFSSESVPEWLKRDESASNARIGLSSNKKPFIPSKFIWPASMLVLVLAAFFMGGYIQRNEVALTAQAYQKRLHAKDQLIQSQESQLTQLRRQLSENSTQLADIKAKLSQTQRELSAGLQRDQRVIAAARKIDPSNTRRSAAVNRVASRTPGTGPSPARSTPARAADPGVYETTRPTSVYENPSSASHVISRIGGGTRINVVSAAGDWLEVRSKRGNPPGYVRYDDARPIARVN